MLKLGLIGISEGNGHPYSWSAIFNGYDEDEMKSCGFPVIPEYLAQQEWPDARIREATVTHVWTQDPIRSQHIARAARISGIVESPEEMVGLVDGLLLARDDAENHFAFAAPFLHAGVPVYIDKPVATDMQDLNRIYACEQYPGQVFTCSALRYAAELLPRPELREQLGTIRRVVGVTPKSWAKYAVHVIEPALEWIGDDQTLMLRRTPGVSVSRNGAAITVEFQSGVVAEFVALGDDFRAPLHLRIEGDRGRVDLSMLDTFSAFKAALLKFIDGIQSRSVRSPRQFNERVVRIIQEGMPA